MTLTHENIRELSHPMLCAQLRHIQSEIAMGFHVAEQFGEAGQFSYSDDGYDDMSGALDIASALLHIDFECDIEAWQNFINPASNEYVLMLGGCDGVAPEIYDWLKINVPDYDNYGGLR